MKKLYQHLKAWYEGNIEQELDKKKVHTVIPSTFGVKYVVTKKVPLEALAEKDVIKKWVWHHFKLKKTSVIESSQPKIQLTAKDFEIQRGRDDNVGTLGGVVRRTTMDGFALSPALARKMRAEAPHKIKDELLGITNAHVVISDTTSNVPPQGIYKPYGGRTKFKADYYAMKTKDEEFDIALLKPDSAQASKWIAGNSHLYGSTEPKVGLNVFKWGRTTGKTKGAVIATNAISTVKYTNKLSIRLKNLVLLDRMSAGGDSGSIIRDQTNSKAVALLFAGSNKFTYGISVPKIEKFFGIEF